MNLSFLQNVAIFPTIVIFRTLLFQSKDDFYYKAAILKSMRDNEVFPDEKFLEALEIDVQKARRIIIDKVVYSLIKFLLESPVCII